MAEGYHKDVALFPILSESRGINIVLKRWMKKGVLPDAIVIEHPAHAAGHLGAATVDGVNDAKFEFKRVIEETFEVFKNLGLESEKIPLVLAGGMANFEKSQNSLEKLGRICRPNRYRICRNRGRRCPHQLQENAGRCGNRKSG